MAGDEKGKRGKGEKEKSRPPTRPRRRIGAKMNSEQAVQARARYHYLRFGFFSEIEYDEIERNMMHVELLEVEEHDALPLRRCLVSVTATASGSGRTKSTS
jgi:hypothetical protein